MAVAPVRLKREKFAKLALQALQNGSVQSSLVSGRREAHTSSNSYRDSIQEALNEKPIEQHENNVKTVAPVLPDEVIESETENFWAPDPETGVFAPAEESEIDVSNSPLGPRPPTGNGTSILDQKVWVREGELEEVERPTHPAIADEPPNDVEVDEYESSGDD